MADEYRIKMAGQTAQQVDPSVGAAPVAPPSTTYAIGFELASVTAAVANIKSVGAAKIEEMRVANTGTIDSYLQVFNAPAASVTLGTTAPTFVVFVPASTHLDNVLQGVNVGGTGLSVAATTTATGSTNPATALNAGGVYE